MLNIKGEKGWIRELGAAKDCRTTVGDIRYAKRTKPDTDGRS